MRAFSASAILLSAIMLPATLAAGPAAAQDRKPIKIAVMNDMSGVYADFQGIGSVVAARLAVEDFGKQIGDRPIEIVFGDHQNKADIGATMARKWYEVDGVEAIVDVPNSGIALAVSDITREKNKVFLISGGVTTDLTGSKCTPNNVHWTFDNYALANGLVQAALKAGNDSWYFLTSDYAFGHNLEQAASGLVKANGGKVLGAVRHPIGTVDFSSFLLQAQASKAKIIALANAGGDTTSAIKGAAEFGLNKGAQKMAGLVFIINNAHALGASAQGLLAVSPFYWNTNDATRAFAQRFQAAHPNKNMPNEMQAGVYAAILHYLKAVKALNGDTSGDKVVAKMKETETDDPLFGKGRIRVDGRKIHSMYLFEVKAPGEMKSPWDYYKQVLEIPGEQAFRPLDKGGCSLVKAN
ncbi:MAG: ABC transporter substrate-binding protein [Pseudorhodoplanes sp.]|uniref:ABC transporter substrate-binding protein n=1 Tax=Pseudorhodoplanes sp. TaxID=1934341 RepID=UPI003D0ADE2A